MPEPTGKVRGYLRTESRARATMSPGGTRQLTSQVDREANDNVTLTASSCLSGSIVTVTMDHTGGAAIRIEQRGRKTVTVAVPELNDQPGRVTVGDGETNVVFDV